MKLWKLKYLVFDKIKAVKDYLTDDLSILAYRAFVIAILIGIAILIINLRYG